MSLSDRLYLYLFYFFRFLTRYTPSVIIKLFINTLSWILYKLNLKYNKIARVNLDLAFEDKLNDEEKERIIHKSYKNLLYLIIDFIKNQGISKEELLNKLTFKNSDIVTNAIKNKEKIIFITAHYGNWELLGLAISAKLIPMTTVGRDLDSKVMNEILEANRKQLDMDVLSKQGAIKGMMSALKKDRSVGILVDQNTKNEEGVLIQFFGKEARHTPSVAHIAKKFDALIIPVYITTDDYTNYQVEFYEPFKFEQTEDKEQDVLNCVQKQADITQHIIEKKPDEWFWFHKRWKNKYEHLYQ